MTNKLPSGCKLPAGYEPIESSSFALIVGSKPPAPPYKAAPSTVSTSAGYNNSGGYHRATQQSLPVGSGQKAPPNTRSKTFKNPASTTNCLNWHPRHDVDIDVITFEYYSLVQASKGRYRNEKQKSGSGRRASVLQAFRIFVMVGTLMIDDNPPWLGRSEDLPKVSERDAFDHAMRNAGARLLLGHLARYISKYGGKNIAAHLIDAMFRQSWATGDGSFRFAQDACASVSSMSEYVVYAPKVTEELFYLWDTAQEQAAVIKMAKGDHHHADSIFKAERVSDSVCDVALEHVAWASFADPSVLTAIVCQSILAGLVPKKNQLSVGDFADFLDNAFCALMDDPIVLNHDWVDDWFAALDSSAMHGILSKIVAFPMHIDHNLVEVVVDKQADKQDASGL